MTVSLIEQAHRILSKNDRGGYTVPNGRVYPFQWNWDSAFVALGFDTYDRPRAWLEVETLFSAQWEDGFVPHIVFWKEDAGYFPGPSVWQTKSIPVTSGITQPPVAASIVWSLWQTAKAKSEAELYRARAAALFRKLMKWHGWFARNRDFENRGLVVALHPWETGRDNSPEWDVPGEAIDTSTVGTYERQDISHLDSKMRPTQLEYDRYIALLQFGRDLNWDHAEIGRRNPFRVADVGMTMMLLRANRDLLKLAADLDETDAFPFLEAQIARSERGIDYLWDENVEAWCSRDTLTGRFSGHITSTSFLSFYAGICDRPRDAALLGHLERISQKVSYLMPSLDPDDPGFQMIRYWRGPVWSVVNYMIAKGLAELGHSTWSERILDDTRALIEMSGFYEAFSPIDGTGSGGDTFSWTAAIWLALFQDK